MLELLVRKHSSPLSFKVDNFQNQYLDPSLIRHSEIEEEYKMLSYIWTTIALLLSIGQITRQFPSLTNGLSAVYRDIVLRRKNKLSAFIRGHSWFRVHYK